MVLWVKTEGHRKQLKLQFNPRSLFLNLYFAIPLKSYFYGP